MESTNKKSIKRAKKTIKCLNFNLIFYTDIQIDGLNAQQVFEMKEKYLSKPSSSVKNADKIEGDFLWLITLGILRREVDGQGLTSRVRLTPLGRQVIDESPELANKEANPYERFIQFFFRKLKFK